MATRKFFVGDQKDPGQLSFALEGAAMHQQHQGWGQTVGLLYVVYVVLYTMLHTMHLVDFLSVFEVD